MGFDLRLSEAAQPRLDRLRCMVRDEIMPMDEAFLAEVPVGDRWAFTETQTSILQTLKAKARAEGLWNLWETDPTGDKGLTTVDYAHFAEEMGRSHLAAEVFNCSAPDTGNMEVLSRFASPAHQERWLKPLMTGEIRSAYLMTEPQVASSDATNISMSCVRDGDHYILNGEKWWITGAGDPRCALHIVLAKTGGDDAPRHARHSMLLVDPETPGITKLRPMQVLGHDDAPHGHFHLRYENVRVPVENLLLGEGRGFEIAQSRLGPGRIHHCMRALGQAEYALELMIARARSRTTFGRLLVEQSSNQERIAEARIAIDQARLLCLTAAAIIDAGDMRAAAPWISRIKVVAPRVALSVCDEAMQMHGGMGLSQDTPLARMWVNLRTLRMVDGPDAVHLRTIARAELKKTAG